MPQTYLVRRGDTLWAVAGHFRTTVTRIARANNIRDTHLMSLRTNHAESARNPDQVSVGRRRLPSIYSMSSVPPGGSMRMRRMMATLRGLGLLALCSFVADVLWFQFVETEKSAHYLFGYWVDAV